MPFLRVLCVVSLFTLAACQCAKLPTTLTFACETNEDCGRGTCVSGRCVADDAGVGDGETDAGADAGVDGGVDGGTDAGPRCSAANCGGCCTGDCGAQGLTSLACGAGGAQCQECPGGSTCEGATCSGCDVTNCPTGCCFNGTCRQPTTELCGLGGAVCGSCATTTSDGCAAVGFKWGGGPG